MIFATQAGRLPPRRARRDRPRAEVVCLFAVHRACQLSTRWYGDGTEIVTGEGKLHLDSVLDMAARRVAGFALGEHRDAALACGALAMAVAVRGGSVPGDHAGALSARSDLAIGTLLPASGVPRRGATFQASRPSM